MITILGSTGTIGVNALSVISKIKKSYPIFALTANKNIKLFNGSPLIEWTIKLALKSKIIDKVVVSSDSKKILNISKKLGSDVILRPKNIIGYNATIESAVIHCIKYYKNIYDTIILLSPTSPLRKKNDLDNSIKFFYLNK